MREPAVRVGRRRVAIVAALAVLASVGPIGTATTTAAAPGRPGGRAAGPAKGSRTNGDKPGAPEINPAIPEGDFSVMCHLTNPTRRLLTLRCHYPWG